MRNRILFEKITNEPTSKRSKEDFKDEALQQLYRLRPDLNGQSVWFFPILKRSAEGRILYEKTEKHAYVYDTITQKRFSSFSAWIQALSKNYSAYFKNIQIVTLLSIKDTLTTMIKDDVELIGINLIEREGFLCLTFFKTNLKKELYIKKTIYRCREPIKCIIFVNSLEVRDNFLEENGQCTKEKYI
ncbi:45924_t:CDS:2, partial [Gigaspora margarita]